MDAGYEEYCRFGFDRTQISDASKETSPEARNSGWMSFDEFTEKLSLVLSALYLAGAIGLSALLVIDAFPG